MARQGGVEDEEGGKPDQVPEGEGGAWGPEGLGAGAGRAGEGASPADGATTSRLRQSPPRTKTAPLPGGALGFPGEGVLGPEGQGF